MPELCSASRKCISKDPAGLVIRNLARRCRKHAKLEGAGLLKPYQICIRTRFNGLKVYGSVVIVPKGG